VQLLHLYPESKILEVATDIEQGGGGGVKSRPGQQEARLKSFLRPPPGVQNEVESHAGK
jgi:hypothetical protein